MAKKASKQVEPMGDTVMVLLTVNHPEYNPKQPQKVFEVSAKLAQKGVDCGHFTIKE